MAENTIENPRPGTPMAKRIHELAERLSTEVGGGQVWDGRGGMSWFIVDGLHVAVGGTLGGHESQEDRKAKENAK